MKLQRKGKVLSVYLAGLYCLVMQFFLITAATVDWTNGRTDNGDIFKLVKY